MTLCLRMERRRSCDLRARCVVASAFPAIRASHTDTPCLRVLPPVPRGSVISPAERTRTVPSPACRHLEPGWWNSRTEPLKSRASEAASISLRVSLTVATPDRRCACSRDWSHRTQAPIPLWEMLHSRVGPCKGSRDRWSRWAPGWISPRAMLRWSYMAVRSLRSSSQALLQAHRSRLPSSSLALGAKRYDDAAGIGADT